MKLKKNLSFLFLVLSLLGCGLRFGIYRAAVDGKGLLISGHPLQLALWGLAAAAAVLALFLCDGEAQQSRDVRLAVLGELLAAVGIALTALTGLKTAATPLDGILLALCVLSGAGLVLAGVCRWRGRPVNVLCYAAPCLFFAIYMVCRYRFWSSHPQLQDWFFPALGAIGGMVFSYLRCVPGKLRLRRLAGCLGCFCCLAALANVQDPTLYLGAACWMITNLHAPGDAL